MTGFGLGEPNDPRARTALEWMRVVTAGVLLALIGVVVVRDDGGLAYILVLAGVLGAVLGLPVLAQLLKGK